MFELHEYKDLPDYAELRIHENRNGEIRFINGACMGNSRSIIRGTSARVSKNHAWGFASTPETGKEAVEKVISKALYNADFLGSRTCRKAGLYRDDKACEERHDFSTKLRRKSSAELMDFMKAIDAWIVSHCPQIETRTLAASWLEMQKELITSRGTYSFSMIPRSFIYVSLGLRNREEPVEHHHVLGGFGQFEDNFSEPELLFPRLEILYEELLKKKDAVFPEAGTHDVVLSPELTGLLAHEAIGHTTEADLVMAGSVAGDFLGKVVGSPLVSLVDFANTAYGELCPQPIFMDDEGVKASDAHIIEGGVLKGFMHNRESAARYNMQATGNARAYAYSDEPIIRMRNTAFLPGASKLEEMIASIDKGYYLIQRGSGQADATSEFMFGVSYGYEIAHGKLARPIKETTISGVAFDLLKTVSMASDTMEWSVQGMCGKKQPMPTAKAGPAFKCRIHIGGK